LPLPPIAAAAGRETEGAGGDKQLTGGGWGVAEGHLELVRMSTAALKSHSCD